ncbi:MAG: type III-B CRISPR module RAMP protein Cmr6, partial [bacterium]|nr:type III-B CRISPR module RAMP protein Cmr6 [bacterium]
MPYGKYLLPNDTARIGSTHIKSCQNFALTVQRYVPHEAIEETDRLNDRGRSIGKERNFWLQEICRDFVPDDDLITNLHQRWMAMTENSVRFTMVTRSRLIVGLGGKGALEFGITLHPVTGLPYIPGSAQKGLCRNYKLLELAFERKISPLPPDDPKQKSEIEKLDELLSNEANQDQDAKTYREIFGTQDNAGSCIFFDAVLSPLEQGQALFELDVMTPHFSDYYSNKGDVAHPPHDADKPIPVTFITIPTGITFSCAVGLRRNANDAYVKDATNTLQKALAEMGIGAKTAAGYGVF